MYSLTSDPNAKVYGPSFVNSDARQNSMAVGIKVAVGPGGLLPEVEEARGVVNSP